MDLNIDDCILKSLVNDESFVRKALPHLRADYFYGADRAVFETIVDYISKYNKLPNATVLAIEYGNSDVGRMTSSGEVLGKIQSLSDYIPQNLGWLIDKTEAWCKNQALMLAITEAVSIIDGKILAKDRGAIPEILQNALSISFDTAVGHDYFMDAATRFDAYSNVEDRIPFDIDMLNVITDGGVGRGTLNVLLGGTGTGKSLWLCHLSAGYLSAGKNVLYITMEMSENRIAERIDANLIDVEVKKIKNLSKQTFVDKIAKIQGRTNGKLIVKQYPTGAAHAGHFRALLQELKTKKDFVPDIICVDYINICSSSRIKAIGGSVNSYTYVKSIAEELRALGIEADAALWTATQTTRSGFDNSDVELTDTSESWGLPASSDLFLAIINTEELEAAGQYLVKQLKNRYNELQENRRFTVGVERGKMRLFDVEDPLANIMSAPKASQEAEDAASTPFSRTKKPSKDFSNFKT